MTTIQTDHLVSFDTVTLTYPNQTVALHDVSLHIDPGEFVSIVGPSGCGKSSLLRLASGLSQASGGICSTRTSKVSYVFQDATLLPWRTTEHNVGLLLELDNTGKSERRERSRQALAAVGLIGSEGHLPHELSGGMRMRASLARALTVEPDLFLFDEPFGALDELTRDRLNDLVFELFAGRGFAGMFVTHSVREAVAMSTRVVVMGGRPGRVVTEFAIPFGLSRGPDLRESSEFADLVATVGHALRAVSEE